MSGMIPMAMYGLTVPCGDVAISGNANINAPFRITMAAIDPSAEAEEDGVPPRATLRVLRRPLSAAVFEDDDDDEDDFDADEMDRVLADGEGEEDDDDGDAQDPKGGPSDTAKSKKALKAEAILKKLKEQDRMDVDDAKPLTNGTSKSAKAKGKMPAGDEDDSEDDDDDDDDIEDDEGEMEEFVICTLDPSKNYQQPLDLTFGEDEPVFFQVTGTHSVYLTGNYVEPAEPTSTGMYDPDDDDDEDYDLEPDDDELDDVEDEEEDELDDMEDPRITEIDEDEEEKAPKLVEAPKEAEAKADKKSNKRPAEEQTIDEMIAKEGGAGVNGEKLSKKQLKKLKKSDGTAGAIEEKAGDAPSSGKTDKKVQFAKELEQGPTFTKSDDSKKPVTDSKDKPKATLGVKTVQGVTVDDKKLGTGPAAKTGDRVGMRYIGKLQKDGKVFDSNKKGKPFSFKLGAGEVIKGWEIGIQGMSIGGERRITIPAHLAYGTKSPGPGIPPNSTLQFEVKLLELNKGK